MQLPHGQLIVMGGARPHTPARPQRCLGRLSHQAGHGTSHGLPQPSAPWLESSCMWYKYAKFLDKNTYA